MTKQEEIRMILENSPYALPNDTSRSGLSASQIKEKFYKAFIVLYDLFEGKIENILASILDIETDLNGSVNDGSYDNNTKTITLTTIGGENISFSIASIVEGITTPNVDDIKLDNVSIVENRVVNFHAITSEEIEEIIDENFNIGGTS